MLVSVLIPSRDRVDILKRSINSLLTKANNPESIQILVRVDFDDYQFIQRFSEFDFRKQDVVLFGNRFRGYKDHHLFLNDLANLSSGEFLFTWNDDTSMISENWDLEIKQYSGHFFVLKPQHNMHSMPDFNGNPIYPKKWVELTGHVAMNCHTDNWINDISLDLGLRREVNIFIKNHAAHWGGDVNDKTYKEGSIHQYDHDDYYGLEKTEIRKQDTEKIKEYLKTCNL